MTQGNEGRRASEVFDIEHLARSSRGERSCCVKSVALLVRDLETSFVFCDEEHVLGVRRSPPQARQLPLHATHRRVGGVLP